MVALRKIDRSNWREAITLRLRDGQEEFVLPAIKSLAAAYVRQYGDHYEYVPMAIYDHDVMVGYVSTLCDPTATDDYWIDDIMIDARFQGRGLGRAAVTETIRFILRTYPRCETIMLGCHLNNAIGAKLYRSLGFAPTGETTSGVPDFRLTGESLLAYR